MEIFSTVLFVDHAPIGYSVQKNADRVELNPAENPARTHEPPRLVAEKKDGAWNVSGTDNAELIQQVLEEVNLAERGLAGPELSAAP